MNIFQRGSSVTIVQRFWLVDPLTGEEILANPDNVMFVVADPDSAETPYVFGVDGNVTNPAVGIFLCEIAGPLPTGTWRWRATGVGTVDAVDEDLFYVLPSGVLVPDAGVGPQLGPCSSWITGQDVANVPEVNVGTDVWNLDDVAAEASMALFEISGRRFTGLCIRKVRPCADNCGCWGPSSIGLGPWNWSFAGWGGGSWGAGAWGWRAESQGIVLGCAPVSEVLLAGYPVREILEVKVGGVVMPQFDTNGNRNWRLDQSRQLVRMDDPGPPRQGRFWPGCQQWSLDDDQPGTFSITYRHGTEPPQLARDAAAQVAAQLYLAFNKQDCQLPVGTTRVTRQGTTVERGLLANWLDPTKPTGLVYVDLFLKAYGGQAGKRRRSAVFTPDRQQFARQEGR